MKLFLAVFLIGFYGFAQVGIGTNMPDNNAILEISSLEKTFVPPRMTNAQMLAINSPLISSLIYNTTFNSLYIYNSLGWKSMTETDNATLVCKKKGGSLAVSSGIYYNLPLNNSNVSSQNSVTYEIISDGKIRIKENGIYMVSAQLAVSNLPSGTKKYALELYKNNLPVAIFNKNESVQSNKDYWGTTGMVTMNFSIGDVVDLKYLIDNNSALDLVFASFSFVKIN